MSEEEDKYHECKPLPKDRAKWNHWKETKFKTWCWKGGRKAQFLIETDAAKKAALTLHALSAAKRFEANMSVFNELKRLFYTEFKDLFDNCTLLNDFATTVFDDIKKKRKPHLYSNVRTKLKELEEAYVFKGNPIKFFKHITHLRSTLCNMGHVPNDVQLTQSCIQAIYKFAHQADVDEADKLWGSWTTNYEDNTPAANINATTLETAMTQHVDRYEERKKGLGTFRDDAELATFHAGRS